ncbi:SPASM domain-containing protein [Streptomyces sp. JNUCC 64]
MTRLSRGYRPVWIGSWSVSLGVRRIGTDRLRQVGRGVRERTPDTSQLCGHCVSGVIAVSPDGSVWPCVFSRWVPVGNVLNAALVDILAGPGAQRVRGRSWRPTSPPAR